MYQDVDSLQEEVERLRELTRTFPQVARALLDACIGLKCINDGSWVPNSTMLRVIVKRGYKAIDAIPPEMNVGPRR